MVNGFKATPCPSRATSSSPTRPCACCLPLSLRRVRPASAFDFTFQVATIPSNHDSGSFRVVTGGTGCDDYTTDLSGLVVVPSTGGWGTFASLPV